MGGYVVQQKEPSSEIEAPGYASWACCILTDDEGLFLSHRASIIPLQKGVTVSASEVLEQLNEINAHSLHLKQLLFQISSFTSRACLEICDLCKGIKILLNRDQFIL